ncbi:CTSB [Branchiostoma lanceolatum]|uniref:CTSB protein n=1 Tax=Branchiostoma lanceolatum TaxID=7740 RepID=A0A8K0AC46_BRALA|nr:CTSB [Branchiostoma lanceolatum]
MRLLVCVLLVTMAVMATLIDDSEGSSQRYYRRRSIRRHYRRRSHHYRRRSNLSEGHDIQEKTEQLAGLLDDISVDLEDISQEVEHVSVEWKQVATHENGLPYNALGSPMFVAPRPTDQKAINLMCNLIQETPLLPNVEHKEEDVTAPNWDLLYADRSEDMAVCCKVEGNEQELCIETLRQKTVDQYCYFWDHSMENALGVNEPCCEETGEGRVQCMDQARFGFDVDIHDADRTIELLQVPASQNIIQIIEKTKSPPAFDNKFCTWAKQQPHLDTTFEEATLQKLDPMQKISEVTRKLISCCYIDDDEPAIDQCMKSAREESIDQLCFEQHVLETGLPLIGPSVVTNIPAGLKAMMSYKDDIPAHPCCQRSYINRYSCFSQEWRGFEASRDTLDHTAEIAQYKEKYNQLKSKIAAKIDFEKTSCDTWYGGKVLPESVEEMKPEAGQNFEGWTEADLKGLCGTILDDPDKDKIPFKLHDVSNLELPESFDAREQWPNCVEPIRNQGHCGSCWAFAATEVLSDRFCIQSHGQVKVDLSPQYMVSCDRSDYGCNGGYLSHAWNFLQTKGTVTNGCMPYASQKGQVPSCSSTCIPGSTDGFGKYKARESYRIHNDVKQIQMDIMTNGPVETAFTVYKDFMQYSGGVYRHEGGRELGGHAVKIVGWGEEDGVQFWRVANSWGPVWGEEGYFRIQVGDSEFGKSVFGGIAKTS